ncbi:MAG: glycosyltransferase family 4 protein [Limisphaerales bacterium]
MRETLHSPIENLQSKIQNPAPLPFAGRRAAVVLYSYYPSDSRPRRSAEALAAAGMVVDLFCLRESPTEPSRELIRGVSVHRLPLRQRRGGRFTYLYQYAAFFLLASVAVGWRSLWQRYQLVHVHNMPDFLVFSAAVPRWRGARVILDLHDPMPELFMSMHGRSGSDRSIRFLTWLERQSIRFAHLVLTPNEAFRRVFADRSGCADRIRILVNSPEEELFDPALSLRHDQERATGAGGKVGASGRPFRVMYHGSLVERHGLDLALEAIARVRPRIPGIRFDIFGARTDYMDRMLVRAEELGLSEVVTYHGMQTEAVVARHIAASDLGVVPNRLSPFTAINLPTRLFEYLAMHRPVIAPATPGIQDYFGSDALLYFRPDDAADLADRILWVWGHPTETAALVKQGRQVYQRHLWTDQRQRFLGYVTDLLAKA